MRDRRLAGVAALSLTAAMNLVVTGCTTTGTSSPPAPTTSTTSTATPPTSTASTATPPTSTASTATPTTSAPSTQVPTAGTLYLLIWGKTTVSVLAPGATTVDSIKVGPYLPVRLVVAPAGTPNAGTVYVAHLNSREVSVIPPGASSVQATIHVGRDPEDIVVAPAGTPNEGTVYVGNFRDKSISVIPPGATTVQTTVKLERSAFFGTGLVLDDTGTFSALVIAPAGTPNAGTLYVRGRTSISVIPPGSTTVQSRITVGEVGLFGGIPVIAPAGTPNAGSLYVASVRRSGGLDNRGTVSVIPPGATKVKTRIAVGRNPGNLVMTPAGMPGGGTVYLAIYGDNPSVTQWVWVIPPGATSVQTKIKAGRGPFDPLIAPAGAPNAGTLYLTNFGGNAVSVIPAGANAVQTRIEVPNHLGPAFLAPAGIPNAGTLYLPIVNKLWIIPPGATEVCTIEIGSWRSSALAGTRRGVRAIAFAPSTSSSGASPSSPISGEATSPCPATAPTPSSPTSTASTSVSHVLILGSDGAIKDGKGKVMPTGSKKKLNAWLEARLGALTGDFEGGFGRLHVYYYDGRYRGWWYGDSPQDSALNFTPSLASTNNLKMDTGVGLGTTYKRVLAAYPSLSTATWDSYDGWIGATIPGTSLHVEFTGGTNTYDQPTASSSPRPDAVLRSIHWSPR